MNLLKRQPFSSNNDILGLYLLGVNETGSTGAIGCQSISEREALVVVVVRAAGQSRTTCAHCLIECQIRLTRTRKRQNGTCR